MKKEVSVDFVKWFSELSNKDVPIAGGKGASLAEMYNLKIPVPPGFVITAQTFSYFLEKTGIKNKIINILSGLNVDDTASLNMASKEIRKVIESAEMPKEIEHEIFESYDILGAEENGYHKEGAMEILEDSEDPFVAVRSSATTEDLADASFAGQQDTFLNVRGKKDLIENVKKCMSSLFTPRAIFYRQKKGFAHDKSYLAVVVQKMVNSEKSGVMFSKNPTKDDGTVVIEAVWGLGEGIVSGQIRPDHYVVDPDLENFQIKNCEISRKKIAIVKNSEGKNETIKLSDEVAEKRVLDNYELKRLAYYGLQLEEHYNKPQDIEFALDKTGIYIVQSRPITTVFKKHEVEVEGEVLLSGLGASPGISSGVVKIIHDLEELDKIKDGDVLVTEMTNPDMVVAMQRAAGIVTDEGGITSHAAIVSREMGIPAVVGTGNATTKLKEGEEITVDGNNGKIIAGKAETKLAKVEPIVRTKTKLKVIVDLPEAAERAAKSGINSVGLTRLEGIIAVGGKHPLWFVKEKDMKDYIKLISSGIKKIAEHFDEMWIRTSDIRSDEYKNLEGAPQKVEDNPMLGDHGVRFSLKHKDIMRAELMAVKEAAHHFPNKKFGIMVPQVISVEEVRETKKISHEVGIPENISVGIMVETPAAVQVIENICEEGISFMSFGTNDLTQFTLAIDRNNEEVQNLFDETNPAIINSIRHVIKVCKKYGVYTSICGQAGSKPEMVKILIAEGIDSISVNADAAKKISELVHEIETQHSGTREYVEESYENRKPVVSYHKEEEKKNHFEKSKEVDVEIFSEGDIEEEALKALGDDEYQPGKEGTNSEIPSLNDSIGVDSDSFNNDNSESDDLGEEWEGNSVTTS